MISIKTASISESMLLEHEPFVRKLARRLSRDESQADDLVQETWLAALRQQHALHGSFRAWLARVMGNLAANRHRAGGRRDRREAWAARDESTPSVAELAADRSARVAVARAVMSLAEPYRTAIVLRFYEGLGPSEIAEELGVPNETVRTRLKRALAMLRRRVDAEDERRSGLALLPLFLLERFERCIDAVGDAVRSARARVRSMPRTAKLSAAAAIPAIALLVAMWRFAGLDDASAGAELIAASAAAPTGGDAPELGSRVAVEPASARGTNTAPAATSGAPRVVTGRTLDARGQPLAGVAIRWWEGSDVDAGPPRGTAQSDARGVYELADLPSTFVIDAAIGDALALETLQGVEVAAGVHDEVDLYLAPARRVRGTVLDERDAPVANVEVAVLLARGSEAYRASHHAGLVFYGRQAATVASDERGAFELVELHEGTQRLLARHPDFTNTIATLPAASDVLEIRLLRGVDGAVEVVGETGRPVAGARVSVRGTGAHVIARTTGDDGRCALPPRAANVPFFARVERDGFGTVVAGPWSLQSGGALHRVVLREPRAVTGRVVDAAGEPLVKARLTARFPIDRQRNEDSGFAPLRELGFVARAFTGADGEFEFASLPRAVLQVDVQPEGETWPTSTTTLDERALELPIVTAVTAGSATLELTVRDGTLGTGIAAFVASLQPLNDSREWSLTRREFDTASGRASWFELPAGDSLIFVDVPGFVASVAQVHLVAGEARALDVEVFPARDLRLRVLKSDGTPLSPANLLISDREGRPILMRAKPRQTRASAPVGPGGEAALCGLPAALVHVEVIAAGEDFGPSFEFDLARDGGEVHTLVVAEHDGPPQRRIELACPESWRGQRVDVFVADADGRRIASYRSASDNAALELQGGRSALYCHRDATNRLREAWSRALLRWDAADDLAGVPPTSLLVPSSECSLDVFVAGRLVARKRLAADSTGVVVDLRELGGSSTAKQ